MRLACSLVTCSRAACLPCAPGSRLVMEPPIKRLAGLFFISNQEVCMSEIDRLKSDIDELVPDMVALRRDLHEHPELGFEEVRTSGIVAGRLRARRRYVAGGSGRERAGA